MNQYYEYLQRHDRVTSFIRWILCKNFNLPHTEKWYEHTPQQVIESTEITILWDVTINVDTVPADKHISLKEFQKLSKYKNLKTEVTKMWKLKTKSIPVVTGALGIIKKGTQNFVDQTPGKPSI